MVKSTFLHFSVTSFIKGTWGSKHYVTMMFWSIWTSEAESCVFSVVIELFQTQRLWLAVLLPDQPCPDGMAWPYRTPILILLAQALQSKRWKRMLRVRRQSGHFGLGRRWMAQSIPSARTRMGFHIYWTFTRSREQKVRQENDMG